MWICSKCKESSEDTFDSCWSCGTGRGELPSAAPEKDIKEAQERSASTPTPQTTPGKKWGTWMDYLFILSMVLIFAIELWRTKASFPILRIATVLVLAFAMKYIEPRLRNRIGGRRMSRAYIAVAVLFAVGIVVLIAVVL